MANDNYMNHLAQNDRHGTQLQSMDQKAAIARAKCDDNHEAFQSGGVYTPCSAEEYRAMSAVDRRKQRGGSNFEPEDIF